jgi:hypothetical protein
MKTKLLVAAVAMAAAASAQAVPVTVDYTVYVYNANTNAMDVVTSSSISGTNFINSNTLTDATNKTNYLVGFSIASGAYASVTWQIKSNENISGSEIFDSLGGGTVSHLASSTGVEVGTSVAYTVQNNVDYLNGSFYGSKVAVFGSSGDRTSYGGSPTDTILTWDGTHAIDGHAFAQNTGFTVPSLTKSGDNGTGDVFGGGQTTIWAYLSANQLTSTTGNLVNDLSNYANIWAAADVTYNQTPEPGTALLAGLGLLGMAGLRRKS